MSNSGEYIDANDETKRVFGTPIRVDKLLREAASRYQGKDIQVIFNDIDTRKIDYLRNLI